MHCIESTALASRPVTVKCFHASLHYIIYIYIYIYYIDFTHTASKPDRVYAWYPGRGCSPLLSHVDDAIENAQS